MNPSAKRVLSFGPALLGMLILGSISHVLAQSVELLNVTNTVWRYDQSGTDLGQIWRGAYDDSTWPTGLGLFAGGETTGYGHPFNTPLTRTAPDTCYLRARFNWTGGNQGLLLTGTLYIDDGAVIYVNGREAYRYNVSTASWPVDAAAFGDGGAGTYAVRANPGGEPVIETILFPGTNVVDGENIIAVQVHQDIDTSSDVVFGLQLHGQIAQAPAIVTQPVGTNVMQGRPFTLAVEATGFPAPTYQWFKDGLPIAGATGASYTVAAADPDPVAGHGGLYYVEVSNSAGSLNSDTVTVSVSVDDESPILLYASLRSDGTLRLAWSEVMGDFVDLRNVFVYDPSGPGELIGLRDPVVQTGGADFILTPYTSLTVGIEYEIFIGVGAFKDQSGNDACEGCPVEGGILSRLSIEVTVADYGALWSYDYSGADLVTNDLPFYVPGFDDSAWPTGLPPFGTDRYGHTPEDPSPIVTPVPPPPTGPITTYYRLRFRLCCGGTVQLLRLGRVLYDDGFVAYLNGVEVARLRVPAGQDATTLATNRGTNSYFLRTLDLPLTNLVEGENVLAVELHQSSTNDYPLNIWACDVVAVLSTDGGDYSPEITGQITGPVNLNEGDSLTLAVSARGTGTLFYQWTRDATPIAGATNRIYSVPRVTPAQAGSYAVRVSNMFGSEESAPVTVHVIPETTPPTVVSAFETLDPTIIQINFSEAITAETATNTANYTVALRVGGGDLTIVRADLRNGTNVVLTTSPREDDSYRLTVRDVSDRAAAGNLIRPNPTIVEGLPREILLADALGFGPWTYNDTGADQGTAWREVGFRPGEDWLSGWPLFYGKRGTPGLLAWPQETVLNLTNKADPPAQVITYYFRGHINLRARELFCVPLKLQYILDDGAVFYVNGTEVLRTGMPSDVVTHQTLASRTTGLNQVWEEPVAVDSTPFVLGTNLVAVEVHQATTTSYDVAFALQLVGTYPCCREPSLRVGISVDSQGNIILEHNGALFPSPSYVQETTALATNPAATIWTTRPGGPHPSPHNAGPAIGTRFFRLWSTP